MKFITFFLLTSILVSQVEITLYKSNTSKPSYIIESKILEKIKIIHKQKYAETIYFKTVIKDRFQDVLNALEKSNDKNAMAMRGISITKERSEKFDFSVPYIFVTECILSLKGNNDIKDYQWKIKGEKIAYTRGSTAEKRARILAKKYKIIPIAYDNIESSFESLKKKKINFVITDNIYVWHESFLKIAHHFKEEHKTGYGIAFKKGSPIKKLFDPYIKYTMKAEYFRSLLLKTYGKEYLEFYKDSY